MPLPMQAAILSSAAFNPAALFRGGDVGVWFDPSDLSTMFQLSSGTTPVTAVEQPVGLILDKSRNLAVGPELVVNGTFNTDLSSWSVGSDPLQVIPTWSSGTVSLTRGTGANAGFSQNIGMVGGRWYLLSFNLVSGNVTIGGFTGASGLTTTGQQTRYHQASSSTIQIWPTNLSSTVVIDNISVKEIAGNHALQATAASRPVLSARYNLLTYSTLQGGTSGSPGTAPTNWSYFTAGTPNNTFATDAEDTAGFALTIDATAARQFVSQTITVAASTVYRTSIITDSTSYNGIGIHLTYASPPAGATISYEIDGVAALGSDVPSSGRHTLTAILTVSTTAGTAIVRFGVGLDTNRTANVTFRRPDCRVAGDGVGVPSYQRVLTGTTNDYDTTGFPLYLRFDGTDDGLATNTITPNPVDTCQVFAGVRKNSDAAQAMVAELSVSVGSNNGTFNLQAPRTNTGVGRFSFVAKGTVGPTADADNAAYAAPVTAVLSGLMDIAGDSTQIRVNGTLGGSSAADAGTGTMGSYPLYIGRRAGTSIPLNGNLYGFIMRTGSNNLDASVLAKVEAWMNSKTRAY